MERGRLPEDLSLHYHSQVLTALEYLVKKRVVHLDIKGILYKYHTFEILDDLNVSLIFMMFGVPTLWLNSHSSHSSTHVVIHDTYLKSELL